MPHGLSFQHKVGMGKQPCTKLEHLQFVLSDLDTDLEDTLVGDACVGATNVGTVGWAVGRAWQQAFPHFPSCLA